MKAPKPGSTTPLAKASQYACTGTIASIPNTSGSSSRQLRDSASRPGRREAIASPSAIPEIMNSSGIRHRLSAIIGHCSHPAWWALLTW